MLGKVAASKTKRLVWNGSFASSGLASKREDVNWQIPAELLLT